MTVTRHASVYVVGSGQHHIDTMRARASLRGRVAVRRVQCEWLIESHERVTDCCSVVGCVASASYDVFVYHARDVTATPMRHPDDPSPTTTASTEPYICAIGHAVCRAHVRSRIDWLGHELARFVEANTEALRQRGGT